jgi:hypothetical protein
MSCTAGTRPALGMLIALAHGTLEGIAAASTPGHLPGGAFGTCLA